MDKVEINSHANKADSDDDKKRIEVTQEELETAYQEMMDDDNTIPVLPPEEEETEAEEKTKKKTTKKVRRRRGGKSKKKTLATGTRGRPLAAETQIKEVEVDGKKIAIAVDVPEKENVIVTSVEIKTKKQYMNPDTPEDMVAKFDEDYFRRNNYHPQHDRMLKNRRLATEYILRYVQPKKVLVSGCATGCEVLAYKELGVPVVGQDVAPIIKKIAFPGVRDMIEIDEIHQVLENNPECDTIQLLDVVQYLDDDVYEALIRTLNSTKSVRYIVSVVNNKGYELQNNKVNQKVFDGALSDNFEKVNDVEDYKFRSAELVHRTPFQIYGLMPQKILWIYKRK